MEQDAICLEIMERLKLLHFPKESILDFYRDNTLFVVDLTKKIQKFDDSYPILERAMQFFNSQKNMIDYVYLIEEGEMGEECEHVLVFYLMSSYLPRWDLEKQLLKERQETLAYFYYPEQEEKSELVHFKSDLLNFALSSEWG